MTERALQEGFIAPSPRKAEILFARSPLGGKFLTRPEKMALSAPGAFEGANGKEIFAARVAGAGSRPSLSTLFASAPISDAHAAHTKALTVPQFVTAIFGVVGLGTALVYGLIALKAFGVM